MVRSSMKPNKTAGSAALTLKESQDFRNDADRIDRPREILLDLDDDEPRLVGGTLVQRMEMDALIRAMKERVDPTRRAHHLLWLLREIRRDMKKRVVEPGSRGRMKIAPGGVDEWLNCLVFQANRVAVDDCYPAYVRKRVRWAYEQIYLRYPLTELVMLYCKHRADEAQITNAHTPVQRDRRAYGLREIRLFRKAQAKQGDPRWKSPRRDFSLEECGGIFGSTLESAKKRIQRYEDGTRALRPAVAEKLAAHLQVPVEALYVKNPIKVYNIT
jgi:hypothetical protein